MPRIAIISPNRDAWSETFIATHVQGMADVALVLTDGHLPKRDIQGAPLTHRTLCSRTWDRMTGITMEQRLRRSIERRLKNERIDVVLAEYGPTGEEMLGICKRLGLPMVVHFHGIDAFHDDLLMKHQRYAAILREAAALVVVSREMESQLRMLGAAGPRLHYLPYGIDTKRFTPGDPTVSCDLIAVGRFVDKKAPHLTLLAFQQALAEEPGLRLVMVGDGPLYDSSVQLVHALGLGDAVDLTGVLPPAEVAMRMRRARAFVQHSLVTTRNDHEGTPLSILEAMASGLPVIATRHGGIPDVVEHGVSGLLSDEHDIVSMAGHMLQVARSPRLAVQLGKAGRERVVHHHRQEERLAELHALLASVARA